MVMKRRTFLAAAAAMGASAALGGARARPSRIAWRERRDLYPEGVASGDPDSRSVLLWTRREFPGRPSSARLTLEVAEDEAFQRVVATAPALVSAASDWTCRVLVGKLRPARVYWYRFTDAQGLGSRVGRTLTAPADGDARPVRFAFVSCQNVNQGAQNAYRRMIFEDERAAEAERLGFVLHLGDFIYEIVWYPEDRPQGMYDRRLRDVVRFAHGEKISDFHVPTDVDDYRAVYRAYLRDPDLQDARARWPFICVWDNHEFSWRGNQGIQRFGDSVRPAQTRKVAANQAWFEYQPARVSQPSGPSLERFDPPAVVDAPIERFDDDGLGQEPNNLKAIASLKVYRALRWGRNVDLILTDHHSYRADDPTDGPAAAAFDSKDFPYLMPQEVIEILDAGRSYEGGRPPATIRYGGADLPNPRKDGPPLTILGAEQKAWFKDRLRSSQATWKVWGNSGGTLDMRADPLNLPPGVGKPWPGAGFATFGGGGWSGYRTERAEILDLVRDQGITGFAVVAGDRHSFWAGLTTKALPPRTAEPVGVEFITGSISAPGLVESAEYRLARDHPLRALFLAGVGSDPHPRPTMNMLVRHGVKSCLEFARTGDAQAARRLSNPDLSPQLSFLDMAGHGYATVRVTSDALECEFVCIPRPLERSDGDDGGPLRYRVAHRARLWAKGERPRLEQRVIEGNPELSI
jgi:alkaline phosphatase D